MTCKDTGFLRGLTPLALLVVLLRPPVATAQHGFELDAAAHSARFVPPTAGMTATDADFPGFDVTYYGLNLDIQPAARFISGFTDVGIRLTEARRSLTLALAAPLVVDSAVAGRLRFTVTPPDASGLRTFAAPRSLPADTHFVLRVYYQGAPSSAYGAIVFGSNSGQPTVWTLSEPYGAMYWFPVRNVPSDKADSSAVTVSVPKPLQVASNGLLVSQSDLGTRTRFVWKSRYPIAMYLISLAIADYQTFTETFTWQGRTMPMMNYWYKDQDLERLRSWHNNTMLQMDLFSRRFGLYPFFEEKYGHAQFTFSGGMEHQTLSSMRDLSAFLSAHELMHQWFGNTVTCATWQDIWINEGFATFGEGLWFEYLNGWSRGRGFYQGHHQRLTNQGNITGPVYQQAEDVRFTNGQHIGNIFSYTRSYLKGAVVADMIRYELGDEAFFRIMTKMVQDTWKHKSITTAQFQAFLETESGFDWDDFFNQWVYGSGHPDYLVRWSTYGEAAGSTRVRITVNQTAQSPDVALFRARLPFRLTTSTGDTMVYFRQTTALQTFETVVNRPVTGLVFDPEFRILKGAADVVVASEPGQAPGLTGFAVSEVFPNPFNPSARFTVRLSEPGMVRWKVLDLNGRIVVEGRAQQMPAGSHTLELNAGMAASGLYLLRVEQGAHRLHRKITLLK